MTFRNLYRTLVLPHVSIYHAKNITPYPRRIGYMFSNVLTVSLPISVGGQASVVKDQPQTVERPRSAPSLGCPTPTLPTSISIY
jgi:hypothetical protein